MTVSHGEGQVFSLFCFAIIVFIFQGLFVSATNIASVVIAFQNFNEFSMQNCTSLNNGTQLNLAVFLITYAIIDTLLNIFRTIIWCQFGCTKNSFSQIFIRVEIVSIVLRCLVMVFGITFLVLVSKECLQTFNALQILTWIFIAIQIPLGVLQYLFTKSLFSNQ